MGRSQSLEHLLPLLNDQVSYVCATSVHPQAVLTADVVLMGISMAGE